MLLAHKCRRVLWLSTINSNSMHQNLLPFFSRIRSGRQALEDWTSVFNRLLPWISHFWHTQGQCNEALPLRYLRSSGGEFRLLLKTGMQLCLSPWQPPQESLMPVIKLTLKKAVWIHAKTLRQNPPHLIVIKILFCTHNPLLLPHLTIATAHLQLHWDQILWALTGNGGHGYFKGKVLRGSVPQHCLHSGSTWIVTLAQAKGPSRQWSDTVPEFPRRTTNYNSTLWRHSILHLYLPAFRNHSIPQCSGHKEKLSTVDRN